MLGEGASLRGINARMIEVMDGEAWRATKGRCQIEKILVAEKLSQSWS